jgi:hypothetical protein
MPSASYSAPYLADIAVHLTRPPAQYYHLRLVPLVERFQKIQLLYRVRVVVLQQIGGLFAQSSLPDKAHGRAAEVAIEVRWQ